MIEATVMTMPRMAATTCARFARAFWQVAVS